jgi:hypothetical protein
MTTFTALSARLPMAMAMAMALMLLITAFQSTPCRAEAPEGKMEKNETMAGNATMDDIEYSTQTYFNLVKKYSDDAGGVDYDAWKESTEDIAALNRQVEMLAQISPENAADQFPSRAAQRSYWINTYNTLVLQAVLEYWPLDSVRDVRISFTSRVVPGKGFFYDRKVVVGGRETNLYDLEKEVLKQQKDPRLHFAFNCASTSCPVLRPWEWTDEQLDEAGRDFVNSPANVTVRDDTVYLSSIFKWYKKDFPKDILAYLQQFSEPELQAQLQAAAENKYRIKHVDYDWAVNDADS